MNDPKIGWNEQQIITLIKAICHFVMQIIHHTFSSFWSIVKSKIIVLLYSLKRYLFIVLGPFSSYLCNTNTLSGNKKCKAKSSKCKTIDLGIKESSKMNLYKQGQGFGKQRPRKYCNTGETMKPQVSISARDT